MNDFVMAYPAIVLSLVAILCAAIGGLFSALLYFVKLSLDNLSKAITDLKESLQGLHDDIGILKDRMQRVETTCEMQRAICPAKRITFPPLMTNTDPQQRSPPL